MCCTACQSSMAAARTASTRRARGRSCGMGVAALLWDKEGSGVAASRGFYA